MLVYLVVQVGTYRHDIKGVYSNFEAAKARADHFQGPTPVDLDWDAARDYDGYHNYEVLPLTLGAPVSDAGAAVYVARKI